MSSFAAYKPRATDGQLPSHFKASTKPRGKVKYNPDPEGQDGPEDQEEKEYTQSTDRNGGGMSGKLKKKIIKDRRVRNRDKSAEPDPDPAGSSPPSPPSPPSPQSPPSPPSPATKPLVNLTALIKTGVPALSVLCTGSTSKSKAKNPKSTPKFFSSSDAALIKRWLNYLPIVEKYLTAYIDTAPSPSPIPFALLQTVFNAGPYHTSKPFTPSRILGKYRKHCKKNKLTPPPNNSLLDAIMHASVALLNFAAAHAEKLLLTPNQIGTIDGTRNKIGKHLKSPFGAVESDEEEELDMLEVDTLEVDTLGITNTTELTIGCLQFEPIPGDTSASINKANMLLSQYSAAALSSLDVLVLPEMAFSGYVFEDRSKVPLEDEEEGMPTVEWCKRIAEEYECVVVCGFPRGDKATGTARNSAVIVDNEGDVHSYYDKHFLFTTDNTWASPGEAFHPVVDDIRGLEGIKVGLGICMDINPHEFSAPFSAYELANHCLGCDLLLFSSNWCSSHPDDGDDVRLKNVAPPKGSDMEREKVLETINYWLSRLKPMLETPNDCYFVCADRVGTEEASRMGKGAKGVMTYVGCSCVLDLKEVRMISNLDMWDETLLVSTVKIDKRRV